MAILIDPPAWPAHGTLWSHLVSDTSTDELHAFAARLGVPRRGFDLDHYDVPASLHAEALALGARAVTAKQVVFALRHSGLRVRQVDRPAAVPLQRREFLVTEWSRLGQALGSTKADGAEGPWSRLGESLLARWNEPHRRYHTEVHLEDVLLALDQLHTRGERVSPATLAAAWFHDAVYAGAETDEQDSAALATRELGAFASLPDSGITPAFLARVESCIVATAPAQHAQDPDPALSHLRDADLAIFAAAPPRYEAYTTAVREEYAHVSQEAFATGRSRILMGYLEQTAIYRTPAARQLWEERARSNLTAEVTLLERSLRRPDRDVSRD
ncbi:DUF4031 domain-containing protein [Leucobacter insecticola]|uniref:DUF4031 domain-containing protein n=1 Tax=Leucobacter insecticola TaxID=2714934 RepID=A0A6G8FIY0_9MICO|nr:DUF4031 domain-containing protein [Leucobacter insecticola]QIM16325.1 DUF4031 domain-containing protein [Leucobacter insecticola]